jgi:hypothetical protein
MKDPCNDSYCLIDLKFNENNETDENYNVTNDTDRRRLNSKKNNNSFGFYRQIKINKQIINKKIRKLKGYDSTMGSVTKNDILYYLDQLKNTLYNFNESYLGKDYKSFNNNISRYITKINCSYLQKLKRSIDFTFKKFSSILTEDSYNQFEDILFNQYNDIEIYINNNSNLIELSKEKFLCILNRTSLLFEFLYNISYTKVNSLYDIYYNIIQEKFKYLSKEDINSHRLRLLEVTKTEKIDDENDIGDIMDPPDHTIKETLKIELSKVKAEEGLTGIKAVLDLLKKGIPKIFKKQNKPEEIESVIKDFKFELESGGVTELQNINQTSINLAGFCFKFFKVSIKIAFSYPFFTGLELGIVTELSLDFSVCIEIGMELNFKKDNATDEFEFNDNGNGYSLYIDGYGILKSEIGLDVGFYIPFCPKENKTKLVQFVFYTSINIGIKGILVWM